MGVVQNCAFKTVHKTVHCAKLCILCKTWEISVQNLGVDNIFLGVCWLFAESDSLVSNNKKLKINLIMKGNAQRNFLLIGSSSHQEIFKGKEKKI